MSSTTVVKDPVCGMDIDTSTAADTPTTQDRPITFAAPNAKRSSIIIQPNTWPSLQRRRKPATAAAAKRIEG